MAGSDSKTYRGNCHCGAFIYEVTIPEIKTVFACNCGWCSRKAHLYVPLSDPASQFALIKGEESNLTTYAFGNKTREYKFCPTCGTSVLCRSPSSPEGRQMVINARSVQDLDLWNLNTVLVNGAALGPYHPAVYDGPEPKVDIEGSKTYYGSCYCHKVKTAVKIKPLDETYDERVTECNCSICRRNGYVWAYPNIEQVVVTGTEHLTEYAHASKIFIKTFCSVCGVNIGNDARELSAEELADQPEGLRTIYPHVRQTKAVNLRVLDGVDLSVLKVGKNDGWNTLGPQYVNP